MKLTMALILSIMLIPVSILAENNNPAMPSLPAPTESMGNQVQPEQAQTETIATATAQSEFAQSEQKQAEEIAQPEQPAEPSYQVELLVFRFVDAQPLLDDWQNPAMVNTSQAVDLVLPDVSIQQTLPNYCLLPHKRFIMNHEEQRIGHQKYYQILLHIAWTQTLTDKWHSKPVHISGGKNYTVSGEFTNEVDGTVSISQSKFLTFKSDLCFTEPSSTLNFYRPVMGQVFTKLPNLLSYHLNAQRRMKIGELNYLDNPNFGVLVKVVPLASS